VTARVAALLLVGAMLLTGCGGEDVATDATDTTTGLPTDRADEDIAIGPGLDFVGEECEEALEAFSSIQLAQTAALGGALEFAELERDLQALTAAAPAEIRPAFETYSEELGSYLREVDRIGLEPGQAPTAEQIERLGELAETLDQAALEQAGREIGAYFEEHCGR
jgi:hypothetical protein